MTGPKTPEEALAHVQEAAAKGELEFAGDQLASQVNEQIQRIYREIRIVERGAPPKRGIWVGDNVAIDIVLDDFGKSEKEQLILAEVSRRLGIPIASSDTWVEVGLRLRDHENAARSADRH